MNQNLIAVGSVRDVYGAKKAQFAEALLEVERVILVDVSGSMDSASAEIGKTRHAAANEALARLQRKYPGKLVVVVFSSDVKFCPRGVLPDAGGGTDLAAGLAFCRVAAEAGIPLIVVSDGLPDSPTAALDEAKHYPRFTIDTIYVGPESGPDSSGKAFLEKLAKAAGGRSQSIKLTTDLLEEGIQKLLPARA